MSKINEETYLFVANLLDELKSEDLTERIKSINSLPLIGETLGQERTRSELLPFLQGLFK
jgi:serine/threonine-protein phosphatase 2A regulatory subunit A